MKKFLLSILLVLLTISVANAKTAFVAATALIGGGTGALDAIECEDILGDGSNRAIATGDVAIIMTSGKDWYVYRYISTGADSESSPDIIVPDDRAQCSNQGQWELMDSITFARSATPQTIWRDSNCTDKDDNVYSTVNCTDTGSGTEDCDYTLSVQIAGAPTDVFTVDADGYIGFPVHDVNLGSGHVYRINGTQISSSDLTDVASIAMLDEAETIAGNWVNTDNPWDDNEVADDITITNITQITNRSHTNLSDIGTNAHSAIDTHIGRFPAAGTDPDVDATNELGMDTDGANESGDFSYRGYDGANQFLIVRKLKCIHATAIKPQDWADAVRDRFPIWDNNTGMTFTITEIKAWADVDNSGVTVFKTSATNWTSQTVIDVIDCAADGTGVYTDTETAFDVSTVSHDEMIHLDFDNTDDPGVFKISICGWYNADVD